MSYAILKQVYCRHCILVPNSTEEGVVMKMNSISQGVMAAALVAIAVNISIVNIAPQKSEAKPAFVPIHKVVPVVGKYSSRSGSPGFVVQDGNELRVVNYDSGSMFDRMAMPKYISIEMGEPHVKPTYAAADIMR